MTFMDEINGYLIYGCTFIIVLRTRLVRDTKPFHTKRLSDFINIFYTGYRVLRSILFVTFLLLIINRPKNKIAKLLFKKSQKNNIFEF